MTMSEAVTMPSLMMMTSIISEVSLAGESQTDKQTDRHAGRHADRQTHRRTDMQADTQTDFGFVHLKLVQSRKRL